MAKVSSKRIKNITDIVPDQGVTPEQHKMHNKNMSMLNEFLELNNISSWEILSMVLCLLGELSAANSTTDEERETFVGLARTAIFSRKDG